MEEMVVDPAVIEGADRSRAPGHFQVRPEAYEVPPSFVRRVLLYSREKLVDAMLGISHGFFLFGRHG
jgi:hypothetical protein